MEKNSLWMEKQASSRIWRVDAVAKNGWVLVRPWMWGTKDVKMVGHVSHLTNLMTCIAKDRVAMSYRMFGREVGRSGGCALHLAE